MQKEWIVQIGAEGSARRTRTTASTRALSSCSSASWRALRMSCVTRVRSSAAAFSVNVMSRMFRGSTARPPSWTRSVVPSAARTSHGLPSTSET